MGKHSTYQWYSLITQSGKGFCSYRALLHCEPTKRKMCTLGLNKLNLKTIKKHLKKIRISRSFWCWNHAFASVLPTANSWSILVAAWLADLPFHCIYSLLSKINNMLNCFLPFPLRLQAKHCTLHTHMWIQDSAWWLLNISSCSYPLLPHLFRSLITCLMH